MNGAAACCSCFLWCFVSPVGFCGRLRGLAARGAALYRVCRTEAAMVASGKIEAVEHTAHDAEVDDYLRIEWERHARQAGYKRDIPKQRSDAAISEQRKIGWVMMSGAVLFALWVLRQHQLRVYTEGDVVIGTAGQRVELDSIVSMDRKSGPVRASPTRFMKRRANTSVCASTITSLPAVRRSFSRPSAGLPRGRARPSGSGCGRQGVAVESLETDIETQPQAGMPVSLVE